MMLFLCSLIYANGGYKITLKLSDQAKGTSADGKNSTGRATLCLSEWYTDIPIDSVGTNQKGEYTFKGKNSLKPGEYVIKYPGGNLEIFVSGNAPVKEEISIAGNTIVQKRGTQENNLFLSFQNVVNDQLSGRVPTAKTLARIDSIRTLANNLKESIFPYMLEGYSNTPDYAKIFSQSWIPSTRFGKNFLNTFFKSIEYNHTDSVMAGVRWIIGEAHPDVKPAVAYEAYSYFSKPKVMGQETIAYNVVQEYFLNNMLQAPSKDHLFEMKSFVMLNGKSLIGMEAQELLMQDTLGNATSLKELIQQGEYTILYFYTDDCVTCRLETPKLVDFVNNYNQGVLNVYAVYTQDYIERWKNYINSNFHIYNPFVNWTNASDPQFESGFHLLYNVISTPQIYLLNNEGIIIGRDLSVKSLSELISSLKENQENMHNFFKAYFSYDMTLEQVKKEIDNIYLKSSSSTSLFKELFAELYTFLKFSNSHTHMEAAIYLAQNYILGLEELWSDICINRVEAEVEQFSKNSPGTKAADITFSTPDGNTATLHAIEGDYKIICFYNSGCNSCLIPVDGLNGIAKRLKGKNIPIIAADISKSRENWLKYISTIQSDWVNLQTSSPDLHQNYYLEKIPLIYILDKDNVVVTRNIQIDRLERVIDNLQQN